MVELRTLGLVNLSVCNINKTITVVLIER